MLAHPTKAMLDEMIASGLFHTLTGMETNSKNIVLGFCFNFIFSNGQLTQQRDEYKSYFNHIMPEDVPEKIKSVNIYYTGFINGFHFFDKENVSSYGRLELRVQTGSRRQYCLKTTR